jgi:hypothetical protein
MSDPPHKSKKDLKRESLELALTERRWFLFLAVVLTLATAVGPFVGAHWPVPTGTGVGALLSALAGHIRK